LHYHMGRLTACGLLRQGRVEPRAGRPIRYYRAVAESFLINLADVGESLGEGLNRELRRSLAEQTNLGEFSLFYHNDEIGRFRVRMIDRDGRPRGSSVFEHWKVLRLTAEQRTGLAEEIAAVIARYEAAASSAGELFLVHAAFAPKLS
jgi:hypothetical protein